VFNRTQIDRYTALTPRLRFADGDAAAAGGTDDTTSGADASAADATSTNTAGTATGDASSSSDTASKWDGKIESLDPAAQKIITDLRKEAADNRVKASTAETRTKAILKAAGIETEEEDPAALLTQSQAAAASAKRELAVFKAASNLADPVKLLDRTSFMTSIAGIDPTDGPAIKAAIEAAVAADSTLKAARAAGASAVDTAGGTGETGQITEAQLAQMTPEEIVEAQKKGLLRNLLS
jgi:hypothetical protein